VLTVSDTGTGIPPDLLPKVLEPFFTTKESGHGTGLGLSMAYGFARQSGGTLRIRSLAGQGTDVELWLPRSEALPDAAPVAAVEPQPSAQRGTAHVLLVDDSQTLRSLTEMQLAEHGYVVTSVSSGVEAIAMIGQAPAKFDLLLTDYAMPMMSGLERGARPPASRRLSRRRHDRLRAARGDEGTARGRGRGCQALHPGRPGRCDRTEPRKISGRRALTRCCLFKTIR
jgi:hypothetical protein